jgi:hypothetical protein
LQINNSCQAKAGRRSPFGAHLLHWLFEYGPTSIRKCENEKMSKYIQFGNADKIQNALNFCNSCIPFAQLLVGIGA